MFCKLLYLYCCVINWGIKDKHDPRSKHNHWKSKLSELQRSWGVWGHTKRRKRLNWWAHLELCHRNPGLVERVLNWINCGEVHTYASYKTTRTWENFNNRGTKMILLSDKLWLIANNSKSFANGSKSIIRNNLGLFKRSEIYLIQNFWKHYHASNGIKINLAGKNISKKLMIYRDKKNGQKNGGIPPFDGKRSCRKRIKGYDTGEVDGSRHSFVR